MSKIQQNFWSENGIAALHSQHLKSNQAISDLILLLESRNSAEESYYAKLSASSALKLKSSESNFLLPAYQEEVKVLADIHKSKSQKLGNIIQLLRSRLSADNQALKNEIDTLSKTLEKQRVDVDVLQKVAWAKFKASVALKQDESKTEETIGSMDVMMRVGSMNMTVGEFNNSCFFLQKNAASEDLKGFLGVTKDCVRMEVFIKCVCDHLQVNEEDGLGFLSDLVTKGFLTKLSNVHVKWKKMFMEGENASVMARREADLADLEYRKLVDLSEVTRIQLERKNLDYMLESEKEIKDRVSTVKAAFNILLEIDAPDVTLKEATQKRLSVFLEAMDPEKEVLLVIEQYRTGSNRIKPVIYENYFTGPDVIFGVSLEQTIRRFNRKVPLIISKSLDVISEHFSSRIGVSPQIDSWIKCDIDHPDVISLVNECNSGVIDAKILGKYSIDAVIGLLARYLFLLPNSVCSNEVYEPLKILYLSKADDMGNNRLNSLRSVLSSIPGAHFHVLLFLAKYWYKITSTANPDEHKLNDLCVTLGPLILRPDKESKLTLHDKHPSRLLKDLLLHFEDIFSLDVLSTQTSMDDLEASLRESLNGSPVIESQAFSNETGGRKMSEDIESPSINLTSIQHQKSLNTVIEQEPTPVDTTQTFEVGEE